MIKILWADDQTDVVNTFSSILAPLSAKTIYVGDGNEAVKKLKTEHFDILLLDLKMPPEEWGGLWALEEIRKFNQKIPVIILSGEGTQNETIKALRLGAQDYVTKDKVQTDLLQRVEMVLRDSDKKIVDDLTNHFPTLISLPYKRYLNTQEPTTRLHRLLEFFEAYLRFSCIVGICEIQKNELLNTESEKFKSLIQQPPSMGLWNQSRFFLAKNLSRDSIFAQLHTSIDNDFAQSLVNIRNDIAHGAEPSEALAAQYLKQSEGNLNDFAKKIWQSLDVELVLPTKFQFDGTKFEVDGVFILGSNNVLPKTSFSTSAPLISNQPYLAKKSSNVWVNLFPFIVLEPSTEPAAWKIMVFDGLKMDRNTKNINGEENLRYIDILSGQRNFTPMSKPVSKMLPNFMTDL